MAQISFHPATKEGQQEILGEIRKFQPKRIGPVIGPYVKVEGATRKLYWRDPADVVVGGVTFVAWDKTIVVRKAGATPPQTPDDGVVVATETTKDQHATNPLVDDVSGETGDVFSYRAFPTDDNGVASADNANIFRDYIMYGYTIDESDPVPNTCVTYTDGAVGLDPAYVDFDVTNNETTSAQKPSEDAFKWGSWKDAFFMPRPCMLKSDGTVAYYLDPSDYTKREDGVTDSDVSNAAFDGNAMMEWPRVFVKASKSGDLISVKICSVKADEDFECWPCMKADGTYADHWYTPIYEGAIVDGKMRSMSLGSSATMAVSMNQTAQYDYAKQNGDGWANTTIADEELIKAVAVLMFRRLDFHQAVQGDTGSTDFSNNKPGLGNTKGMFWGQQTRKTTFNMKFFGMENWWGVRWRRVLGVNLYTLDTYTRWWLKMTKHCGDGTTCDDYVTSDAGSQYRPYNNLDISCGATNYLSSFITKMNGVTVQHGDKRASAIFLPAVATSGSNSTHYCDGIWTGGGLHGVLFGGNANSASTVGLFAVHADHAPSYSNANFGASLSYHEL